MSASEIIEGRLAGTHTGPLAGDDWTSLRPGPRWTYSCRPRSARALSRLEYRHNREIFWRRT
jgi:hypothetical protein